MRRSTTLTQCDCQQAMVYLFLALTVLSAVVHGQSIITPPANITGRIQDNVQFNCTVIFGARKTLTWKFNNDIIYVFQHGEEDYHMGSVKYSVTQDGETFMLTINNLSFEDGGWYSCSSGISSEKRAALTILGEPMVITPSGNIKAGSSVLYTCEAKFSGPRELTALDQHPDLKMYFEGTARKEVEVQFVHRELNSFFIIRKMYNLTVDANMNGKELVCKIHAPSPLSLVLTKSEKIAIREYIQDEQEPRRRIHSGKNSLVVPISIVVTLTVTAIAVLAVIVYLWRRTPQQKNKSDQLPVSSENDEKIGVTNPITSPSISDLGESPRHRSTSWECRQESSTLTDHNKKGNDTG